ncbi:MAG TPA: hypothetical protein VF384_10615 [Planctomycetota bacterium]
MRTLPHFAVFAVAMLACSTPTRSGANERVDTLAAELESVRSADPAPSLTEADRVLLDAAQLSPDTLPPSDLAACVVLLRFASTARAEDWPAVEELAASHRAREIAWPLTFLMCHGKQWDGAARTIVIDARSRPAADRAPALWKWWEHSFAARPDYGLRTRDLTFALLRRFESGTVDERAAVADLLGRPGMTDADVPVLRDMAVDAAARRAPR